MYTTLVFIENENAVVYHTIGNKEEKVDEQA
jgi:hypothetical protein